MAASIVTDSDISTPFNDSHYCFTHFNYAASGDTVQVPVGCLSAAVLVATGTAPTVTIAAGTPTDTVTLTGGNLGNALVLVSRHGGNTASAR
jgi:hypothetical protein